jgi:hypothetical protein
VSQSQTDPIPYTKAFREKVQGRLTARFRLTASGIPEFKEDPDGLRNYTLDVYLESPQADEIDGVEYAIIDPESPDPRGYSADADNNFPVWVETYGDIPVEVTADILGREYKQRAWLSNMLENGHAGETNPAILDAIRRIKAN